MSGNIIFEEHNVCSSTLRLCRTVIIFATTSLQFGTRVLYGFIASKIIMLNQTNCSKGGCWDSLLYLVYGWCRVTQRYFECHLVSGGAKLCSVCSSTNFACISIDKFIWHSLLEVCHHHHCIARHSFPWEKAVRKLYRDRIPRAGPVARLHYAGTTRNTQCHHI